MGTDLLAEQVVELKLLLADWHEAHWREMQKKFPGFKEEVYHETEQKTSKERSKYICLDVGTSGAFMLDKATGEIFCIKGYGQIDRRKRVGVLGEVTGADLVRLRFWRLR